MFLSTFELLQNVTQLPRRLGPPGTQFPKDLLPLRRISREVIQGYFLTISNLENREIKLEFKFNVVSDAAEDKFSEGVVATFFDATGINTSPRPIFNSGPNQSTIIVCLKPKDTGLLIVQPNPQLVLKPLEISEIEIRGYVEVQSLVSSGNSSKAKVLLSPEQRGTFYQLDIPLDENDNFDFTAIPSLVEDGQLDQIAYSVPTKTGGSFFEI